MPAMYMIVQRVIRIHTPTLARQTKLVHVNAVGRGNFRFFSGCLTLLLARLVCRPLSGSSGLLCVLSGLTSEVERGPAL